MIIFTCVVAHHLTRHDKANNQPKNGRELMWCGSSDRAGFWGCKQAASYARGSHKAALRLVVGHACRTSPTAETKSTWMVTRGPKHRTGGVQRWTNLAPTLASLGRKIGPDFGSKSGYQIWCQKWDLYYLFNRGGKSGYRIWCNFWNPKMLHFGGLEVPGHAKNRSQPDPLATWCHH